MTNTISIGELRQNPTRMLRDVKRGATYTITDRGEPIAQVASHQEIQWVPGAQINSLLQELGADPDWAREIDAQREAEEMKDPWGSSR